MSSKKQHRVFRLVMTMGYLVTITLFVLYGSYLTIRYFTYSQTCFTVAQVQSDTRCLFILSGKVYEKGTRSKPHKNNTCGTDVTNIIPSFHTQTPLKYLDPNFVGNICTNQPAATGTPIPTATPGQSAQPTATPTSFVQPTSPSSSCAKHAIGDANCDGIIDIADYEVFRKEFTHVLTTLTADFNNSGSVTITDFETWRRGYTNHL